MDITRKAKRANDERTLQYRSQQETLLLEELHEDKLMQLLAFIERLERTPPEKPSLNEEPNSSVSASESTVKPRANSTLGSATGWTGTFLKPSRVVMLGGRKTISSSACALNRRGA